ncbi:hypothetical protein LUX01_08010 [Streptomyces sudanensis]|uniref:hypothetical protein n=1 Tax=Streptomyces sudanensis TaxID=436397 RepID=UPI0020CB8F25|nr:hypothetical protein [Streptomyces sudanensis]MCP9986648.1 hypothetical protein [Streptomyces sudanensis]
MPRRPDGTGRGTGTPGCGRSAARWARPCCGRGGLAAYQTRGADLDDYRPSDALCAEAPLSALVTALGKRGATTTADTHEHPALDRAYCSVRLGEPPAGYEASLRYELHKKIDPAPEFEAVQGEAVMPEEPGPEPVPGLGEKAYFTVSGGTYAEIVVLDGPAVIGLSVGALHEYDGDADKPSGEPTHAPLDGVKEFMVEDVREIMKRLRSEEPPGRPGTSSSGAG